MRKGKSAIFYVPTVYNPKSNATEPLPMGPLSTSQSESRAGGSIYDEGPDRSGHLFPSVTIDPLSIAIAKPDPKYQDETGFEPEDSWRQHNMLTTIRDEGLHVSPYKDAYATSIPNDAGSRLVTLQNIRDAFSDCDGKLLSEILEHPGSRKATPVKIATCENIQTIFERLNTVIEMLLSLQNRLQTLEDRPYDGSGASTNIGDGNANPGPGDDTSRSVPYIIQTLNDKETGNDYTQITPTQYLQSSGLAGDTVYAIDFYRVNSTPQAGGQSSTTKEYQGTRYVRSNNFGQVSYKLGVAEHSSGTSGALYGGGFSIQLVFRTLRPSESPVNVVNTP